MRWRVVILTLKDRRSLTGTESIIRPSRPFTGVPSGSTVSVIGCLNCRVRVGTSVGLRE